jgi:hypothetical protein
MHIWRRVTATRYTRSLECEVVRLRAENRALLNSILGIAGVPPITVESAPEDAFVLPAGDVPCDGDAASEMSMSGPSAVGSHVTAKGSRAGKTPALHRGNVQVAAPMRKRSWQQINRALEFASVRKKERSGNLPGAGTKEP